jgi:hypothetical protein
MIAWLITFVLVWILLNLTIPLILETVDGTSFYASEHPFYCKIQGWVKSSQFPIASDISYFHQLLI